MSQASIYSEAAGLLTAMMLLLWLVSVWRRNASIVDPFWGTTFVVAGWWYFVRTPGGDPSRKLLLMVLVTVWGLRLSIYLLWRNWGQPEDPRYQAFRRRYGAERYWWVSFFQVFVLQGALSLVASSPLVAAAAAPAPDPLRANDLLGALVFAAGFALEAVADAQLARFRRDPSNRGRALDTGLWRYSRHPNYFGEAVLQWGLWLTALDAPGGAATAVGPALMTWLLLKVSGVVMLERRLTATRPGYADYARRTSAFVPWWPKP